jgi:hypothetical protein
LPQGIVQSLDIMFRFVRHFAEYGIIGVSTAQHGEGKGQQYKANVGVWTRPSFLLLKKRQDQTETRQEDKTETRQDKTNSKGKTRQD